MSLSNHKHPRGDVVCRYQRTYVSWAKAVGHDAVLVIELKPQHVHALLDDHDLGMELNKYASAYTVTAAQAQAKVREEGFGG